jgi:NitT/TauT family transport system substrate-binding protein
MLLESALLAADACSPHLAADAARLHRHRERRFAKRTVVERRATMLLRSALLAVLCIAFSWTGAVAQAPDNTLIRVGTSVVEQAVPILYAAKAGLYEKAGLKVEIQALGGASAVTAALVGGSLEIGRGSSVASITAIAKGLPLTIIGGNSYYDSRKPNVAVVVAADAPIKTPKDLEGKTLAATSLQDFNSVATFQWLDSFHVDRSTIHYVEIPPSATLAAIEQKRVVGSTLIEPFLSLALASGKVRAIGYPYDTVAKRFADSVLFANVKWANEHVDLVRRFLNVTREANTYITAHEEESASILSERGGFDPVAFKNMKHADLGVVITPAEVQPVIDTAAKYNVIPKALQASDILCSCTLRR